MNLLVMGSGFAALTAVQRVRAQCPDTKITLISPTKELIYYPSLIWIPTGKRRDEKRNFMIPCRLLHWAKQAFEWWYLRQYR